MISRLRLALALVERAESLPHAARVRRVLLGLLAVALACACLVVPVGARAQACPRAADHVILARLAVHEAGWEAEADMRAIHAALRRIAARDEISFARAACLHSGRALRGETLRAWVAGLDESGSRPARWPDATTRCRDGLCRVEEHAPWSAYRDRWMRTLQLAAHIVGHADATFTDCAPLTWGSRLDIEAREPLSERTWIDVDCGETRNRFGSWEYVDVD